MLHLTCQTLLCAVCSIKNHRRPAHTASIMIVQSQHSLTHTPLTLLASMEQNTDHHYDSSRRPPHQIWRAQSAAAALKYSACSCSPLPHPVYRIYGHVLQWPHSAQSTPSKQRCCHCLRTITITLAFASQQHVHDCTPHACPNYACSHNQNVLCKFHHRFCITTHHIACCSIVPSTTVLVPSTQT